jgi:hypothetical protein
MTKDEALDLALEELENCADLLKIFDAPIDSCMGLTMLQAEEAITAIKQARSAPVQDPVAWMTQARNFVHVMEFTEAEAKLYGWVPVYTTPPAQPAPVQPSIKQGWGVDTLLDKPAAQRQWVGLTDEEKQSVCRTGPVYAPNGVVTRTPLQYRKELEGVAWTAVRKAEAKLKDKNT